MKIECISSEKLRDRIGSGGEFVAVFSTKWCGFCRALISELEGLKRFVAVEVTYLPMTTRDGFGVTLSRRRSLLGSGAGLQKPRIHGLRGPQDLYDRSRA